MTDETFIRPPVPITITGPVDEHVRSIDVPEVAIAIPAERPEPRNDNNEES
jgi:hypothetical protein